MESDEHLSDPAESQPGSDVGDQDVEEGDLFGDEAEEETQGENGIKPRRRQLDDEELDSGDDEGRDDRIADEEAELQDEPAETEQFTFMDAEMARQPVPEPSDNELYLLKVPRFLSIDAVAWHHKSFQPPNAEHHSRGPPSATFSPYDTALTTLRWRHSPRNPRLLQSNARALRWSDGTLTFQIASNPTVQYESDGKPLAPRQRNPPKPTPTSIQDKKGRSNMNNVHYNPNQDSFTYLTAPYSGASLLRVTNKITAGVSISPSANATDDALERLQSSLAAAARAKNLTADGGIALLNITEDPELAKKKAEAAEKEKLRAQKRREMQESRDRDRANRTLGRSGMRAGGLTVGALEDDEPGFATGANRTRVSRPKPRRQRRDDYSDEEDYGRRKTKEDEYDEEDEFIAKSDEELVVEDDDDEEEEDDFGDEPEETERRGRREKKESPKRERANGEAAAEADEEEAGHAASRTKRRRVVEEDEDE